jgi:prepilin-type N-terminal cleavage/methylation domain-containing protein
MRSRGERGVTLIEMIFVIVIIGMAIPAMMTNFATVTMRSIKSEGVSDAGFCAEQMMEEISSKGFADAISPNNPALGPNSGESWPNFNDVDDYANFTKPCGSCNVSAAVDYASLNTNTWQTSQSQTDFKMVTVSARNARSMANITVAAVFEFY